LTEAIRLRFEWGAWFFYADFRPSNVPFEWDGRLEVEPGRVTKLSQIEFWGWAGPNRERHHALASNSWKSRFSPGDSKALEGIIAEVEAPPNALVTLSFKNDRFQFVLSDLLREKQLVYHVGPKYLRADVKITVDGYNEFRVSSESAARLTERDGLARVIAEATDFSGALRCQRFCRHTHAWIGHPGRIEARFHLPKRLSQDKSRRSRLRAYLKTNATNEKVGEGIEGLWATIPYRVSVNGRTVAQGEKLYNPYRNVEKLVEIPFVIEPEILHEGENVLVVENLSNDALLLVDQCVATEEVVEDLGLVGVPRWAHRGETFRPELIALREHTNVRIELPDGLELVEGLSPSLAPGRHTCTIAARDALANAEIVVRSDQASSSALLQQVVDVPAEEFPLCCGYDLGPCTTANGDVDRVLQMMVDERQGNYVLFRTELNPTTREDWVRWITFCRDNGIYYSHFDHVPEAYEFETEGPFETMPVSELVALSKEIGGPYFLGVHIHERSNLVYGWGVKEPIEQRRNRTMKDAHQAYVDRIGRDFEGHGECGRVLGEGAPVFHYDYEAGVDIAMAESPCGNTVLLLAAIRGASRAYGKKLSGFHVACHVHQQPKWRENAVMWSQCLCLGYMYGLNIMYDEESALLTSHGDEYGFNDPIPTDRRRRMQAFNFYARSHPRLGSPAVRTAFLQGNHSVITAGLSITPPTGVSVWGRLGPETSEWNYSTPEKGLEYVDVFLPGVWLAPIAQDPHSIRRWLSGTPFGSIDLVPATTSASVLQPYDLLFLLDWNTMTDDIYQALKSFVEAGGTLVTSLAQLSTLETRRHLARMEELNLIRSGDLRDLFGVEVKGRAETVARIRGAEASEFLGPRWMPGQGYSVGTAATDDPPVGAAHVVNRGAAVLAVDEDSGKPLLVENRVGKGRAFLFTFWNYPGNDRLQAFVRDCVKAAAEAAEGPVRVRGNPDVHFVAYDEGSTTRLLLLNTDWTEEGRKGGCTVCVDGCEMPVDVKQDELTTVLKHAEAVFVPLELGLFVETVTCVDGTYELKVHGSGRFGLRCVLRKGRLAHAALDGRPCEVDPVARAESIISVSLERRSSAVLRLTVV